MPVLNSRIDPASAAFAANAARMAERLAEVRALEAKVREESASKRDKFEKRGQLLPRERVARLIDRGSDFIEFCPLAGLGMHDDDGDKSVLGGGSIIGIGTVAGKRCVVLASDSAIKGGTIPPMGLKKSLRAQEIARDNRLPLIYLVESGGANLIYQAEIFIEGGRSFANQARLSAAGIPQIAVVHGASTAGGAYLPGLSDYVILVRGRSSIYLAGPPLVKAAIGEDSDEETLGGAETHASVTGLGEYLCENDAHAIATAREVLDKLNWNRQRRLLWLPVVRPTNSSASSPPTSASPTTCARSSRAWSMRPISSNSRPAMRRIPFAAMPGYTATPLASSATTVRSSPLARPRPRSSSSFATRAARR
jgi:geranyl-CoA carboxylase beta subunit